tara:strand:+ start:207 stop:392 length:186 start_codon:yes stop_codon:yes gene_type:complete
MNVLERIKSESKALLIAAIVIFSCTIIEFFIKLEIITLAKTLYTFGIFSLVIKTIFNPEDD